MGKIIAFANQKGGVGKTTTAINLAAALSEREKRVLLCDFDPQGNATSGFGVDPRSLETSIYDLIVADQPDVKSAIVSTKWVDLLGANVNLAGAELDLIGMSDREYRLKNVLDQVKDDYDYVFIDCPPSLGLLTLNCLCAADSFLVPLQCEYYALEGLSQLMTTVRMVKKALNRKLVMEGVLLTMFDGRTNLSIQVVEEVKKHFPGEVRDSFVRLIKEVVALADKMGIPLESRPGELVERNLRILDALAPTASTSMQRDMEAGKQSEVDGLIYQVVRLAEQYGVDVPEYRKIAEAVKKQTENK